MYGSSLCCMENTSDSFLRPRSYATGADKSIKPYSTSVSSFVRCLA